MIAARRLYVTAGAFALAGVACLVVAFLRRHAVGDVIGGIEGAYFSRAVGAPAYAGVFSYNGNVLTPFHPLNAYLWVGAAIAFGSAALVLAGVARFATR